MAPRLGTTDEGDLHWVPVPDVFAHPMTDTNRLMLAHYFAQGRYTEGVYVGTMHGEAGRPQMRWATLSDWEP